MIEPLEQDLIHICRIGHLRIPLDHMTRLLINDDADVTAVYDTSDAQTISRGGYPKLHLYIPVGRSFEVLSRK